MAPTDSANRCSATVEDYVKAILRSARGPRRIASTTGVAEALGITPGSVSAMFKRLADLQLVIHVPYHGVTLTGDGERLALRIVRRHRLLETFLVQTLGMPWDRVHLEADRLEHHLSEELEERIAATLGEPTVDPHGDPIPSADLTMPVDDTVALVELQAGQSGEVASVSDSHPEMLRYLSDVAGIGPGTRFAVQDRQPFGGPLILRIGSRAVVLGAPLAGSVQVRLSRAPAAQAIAPAATSDSTSAPSAIR